MSSRWPLFALGLSLLLVSFCVVHARWSVAQRPLSADDSARLTTWLGSADLALSSSSRWLRHPSLVEPGAAAADGPAALDVDPAGTWIQPSTAVLGQSTRDLRRVPAGRRPDR